MRDIVREVSSYQACKFAELYLKYAERRYEGPREVWWLWGPTGSGKSQQAWAMAGQLAWSWNGTKDFFDGYDGEEAVIFDDFRATKLPFERLLQLLDRYPTTVNIKGGTRNWNARRIFITCPLAPNQLYTDNDPLHDNKQLLRRIAHCTEVKGNTNDLCGGLRLQDPATRVVAIGDVQPGEDGRREHVEVLVLSLGLQPGEELRES